MKLVTYIESLAEAKYCLDLGFNDLMIRVKELSRLGRIEFEQAIEMASYLKAQGVSVIWEWDILVCERDFNLKKNYFLLLVETGLVSRVRVHDPGVFNYVKESHPHILIQLSVEEGNHNTLGLKSWVKYGGSSIERLIYSLELPYQKLKEINQEIGLDGELLILGPLLLFYTPRNLLSHLNGPSEWSEAVASSEESAHKGFKVIENSHGTLMYNTKDICLLDRISLLKESGLKYLRLDLTMMTSELRRQIWLVVSRYFSSHFDVNVFTEFKQLYPFEVTRGYFEINKSDVLFKKLKNQRRNRDDVFFVGEVVEASKSNYLAIAVKGKQSIKLNDQFNITNPDGDQFILKVTRLTDAFGQEIKEGVAGQLVLTNFINSVTSKSIVSLINQIQGEE